jgi:hypothetical protein
MCKNAAMPIPNPAAMATKYQSVGKPSRKMIALPAAKRSPMNPPPKEILCILMPGWRFSVIGHL